MVATVEDYQIACPSEEEALNFLEDVPDTIAVDTETTGLLIRDGRDYAMGVSISFPYAFGYKKFYFPLRHVYGDNYSDLVRFRLRDIIESDRTLIFHHAKFDIVSLRTLGIQVPSGHWICTMMMAHLINENYPYSKSLDSCAKAYLPEGIHKEMPQIMKDILGKKGALWSHVPSNVMFSYAAQDPEVTYRLYEALLPKFKAEGLQNYWPHKARLIEVVIEMEKRGIIIDTEFCERQIDAAEQAMQDYSDLLGGINPQSGRDLQALIIDQLKLPVVKRSGKTGSASFDREAMGIYEQILEQQHVPLAEYILGYRGWQKAKSAFYGAYLEFLSPDGRLRPSYRHHKDAEEGGTVTGRLSCADPNLQQIPRKSDKPWNGRVKQSFKGSPGYSLWEADYAQLELRLGTAYADEPTLKRLFREGRDVFTEMADMLGWERQPTKGFVYSTQYGAGKTRISHVFGVSEDAALGLINQYYETYPRFRTVSQKAQTKVITERKLRLWSGRYRHFHNPREENHKAFNSLIQGGAADIVERIMVHVFDTVDQKSNGEVRMLLQVHDSIIFEIKNGTEDKWRPLILDAMSAVNEVCANFDVVFAVDFHKFGA